MKKEQAIKEKAKLEKRLKKLDVIINKVEKPKNIIDKVNSYEGACKILKIKPKKFEGLDKSTVAFEKLKTIALVVNEGWKPDWKDSSQYKYYPYFVANSAGSGFSFNYYYYDFSRCGFPSRLLFRTSELAIAMGKKFIDLYNDLMGY